MISPTEPLKPYALRSAVAAFMGVPRETITLEHEIGPMQKAVARAIRAYMKDAEPSRALTIVREAAE